MMMFIDNNNKVINMKCMSTGLGKHALTAVYMGSC